MSKERFKAWITKSALTKRGIYVATVEWSEWNPKVVEIIGVTGYLTGEIVHHCHFHRTPDAALVKAREMRRLKMASLRKAYEKLRDMRITLPLPE